MKKKIIAFITLLCLCVPSIASAYKFPNAYWKIHDKYEAAVNSNDYNGIITYGKQAIDMMLGEPQSESSVISLIADRAQRVANAYATLGMYNESAQMFEFFLPYAEKMDWKDSVIIANANIPHYKTKIQLYTDGGTSPYYGSKNEPENGVLFGTLSESETRNIVKSDTAVLVYHELGYPIVHYVDDFLKEAEDKGLTLELALNCPGQGSDIANFESKKYDIENISNLIKQFPNAKVLLRFGAEFNVWGNQATPEQYKSVYRYVSDYFHRNNPNVAMVWSPSAVSNWGMDMNDFYPGDEYVDWVGVSFYMTKYFIGKTDVPDYEQAYFKTGKYCDPVLLIGEVIEKYGERKPIMLSESGVSHNISSAYVSENTTSWADRKMQEYLYYLPMIFPQIKFVAYFDTYVNNEMNNYALVHNKTLQNRFAQISKYSRFIKRGNTNATMCYRPMWNNIPVDGIVPVSCYAHIFGEDVTAVQYYVDGILYSSSNQVPFTSYINLNDFADGTHVIKAVAITEGGKSAECEYTVTSQRGSDIGVYVSDKKVEFDQAPVIHLGRTMVPLRAIFEALGASVDWNGATRTVTSRKGNNTIELTIDSDVLYKNGEPVYLDVPAMLVNNRTLVPVRAVSEALGADVDWNGETRSVLIK